MHPWSASQTWMCPPGHHAKMQAPFQCTWAWDGTRACTFCSQVILMLLVPRPHPEGQGCRWWICSYLRITTFSTHHLFPFLGVGVVSSLRWGNKAKKKNLRIVLAKSIPQNVGPEWCSVKAHFFSLIGWVYERLHHLHPGILITYNHRWKALRNHSVKKLVWFYVAHLKSFFLLLSLINIS